MSRPDASASRDAKASPAPPNPPEDAQSKPNAADGQGAAGDTFAGPGDSSNSPQSPPKSSTEQPARASSPEKKVRFADDARSDGK